MPLHYTHSHPNTSPTHTHTLYSPSPTHTLYLTSLQVMVAKVSSLLKTVKNVEEEAGRGVRSLENTIDSIEADIAEFDSPNPPKETATPEDLIRSTKVTV